MLAGADRPMAVDDCRLAAVFVLLVQRERTNLLLIRRSDRGDPWSNHIAFPGGHVDQADASVLEAAYRETLEEVGIDRGAIELLGDLGHFQTMTGGVDLHTFIGLWAADSPPRPDPVEVAEVIEVPVARLLEEHDRLGFAAQHGDRLGEHLCYPLEGGTIWGVTARIIHHLFELIGSTATSAGDGDPAQG